MTYDTMQDTSTGVPPAPGRSPSGDGDARDAARDAAHHAADQGRAVMGEAADHARDLGDEARRQLDTVAGEARDQARRALSDTTDELSAQIEQRMSDATSLARTRAGELRALAEGRPEDAGPLPDMARRASDRLGHTADRVDELGVRGVIDEVSEFARRRPLLFLAGAAGAGLLVGRLARATRELDGSPGDGQEALATAPTTVPACEARAREPRAQRR